LRFRTLATDFDGRVGFRVYVGQVALHRVVAGQPVVADDGGKDLSIEVSTKKNTSKGIVSWPEDERPRERLLSLGPQAMTDAELIAILVRVGLKGISAVELGRQLLNGTGTGIARGLGTELALGYEMGGSGRRVRRSPAQAFFCGSRLGTCCCPAWAGRRRAT